MLKQIVIRSIMIGASVLLLAYGVLNNFFFVLRYKDTNEMKNGETTLDSKYENTNELKNSETMAESKSITPSFRWNELDFNRPIFCGNFKCFYYSHLSNGTTGYLIYPANEKNSTLSLVRAMATWESARQLEVKYDIRHLLAGPLFKKEMKKRVRDRLNESFVNFEGKIRKSNHFQFATRTVIIQPNYAAPEHSLVVKCSETGSYNKNELENLVRYGHRGFVSTLLKEQATAVALVEQEPSLCKDFQIMIDRDGKFYHLDFERLRKKRKDKDVLKRDTKRITTCLKEMSNYIQKF